MKITITPDTPISREAISHLLHARLDKKIEGIYVFYTQKDPALANVANSLRESAKTTFGLFDEHTVLPQTIEIDPEKAYEPMPASCTEVHTCWLDDDREDDGLDESCRGCHQAVAIPCTFCGYGYMFVTHNPTAHAEAGDLLVREDDAWLNAPHLHPATFTAEKLATIDDITLLRQLRQALLIITCNPDSALNNVDEAVITARIAALTDPATKD